MTDVVPINWNNFQNVFPDDSVSTQWRNLLLTTTSNSISNWSYIADDTGYYPFTMSGDCNTDVRAAAELAISLTTAIKTNIVDPSHLADMQQKDVMLIKSLAYRHIANNPNSADTRRWGYNNAKDTCQNWQSPLISSSVSLSGWMMWDQFTSQDQENIRKMTVLEADRFLPASYVQNSGLTLNVPYYQSTSGSYNYPGDTKAEENSWDSRLLDVATAMMPNHPHYDLWAARDLELKISAFSNPSNVSDTTTKLHDKTLHSWLNGSNTKPDYLVINHNIYHPDYMNAITHNAFIALPYGLVGKSLPKAALFNLDHVYNAFVNRSFTAGSENDPSPQDPNVPVHTILSPGGAIYRTDSTNIYYPENDPYFALGQAPSKFGLQDTEATDLGFGQANNASAWENTHVLAITNSQIINNKTAEAYLLKWLKYQPTTSVTTSELPISWRDQVVGTAPKNGYSTYSSGTFILNGTGDTVTSPQPLIQDQLQYAYKLWSGDGEISARVAQWSPINPQLSQAGIMIRNSLTDNARTISLFLRGSLTSPILYFQYRTIDGGTRQEKQITVPANTNFLKLKRTGSTITAYYSIDGKTWITAAQQQSLVLDTTTYMGLTVMNNTPDSTYSIAQFNNVMILRQDKLVSIKSASASAYEGTNSPSKAIDNNLSTRWSITNSTSLPYLRSPNWIKFDLGSIKAVDALDLAWYQGDHALARFDIQVSTDNTNWSTVYEGMSKGSTLNYEKYYFAPNNARYVKVIGYGNSVGELVGITEARVYSQ